MSDVDQEELIRFLDKTANVTRLIADKMPGQTEPGTVKEKMIKHAEEAVSWAKRLEGTHSEAPSHAVISVAELEDALS